ncbi:glycosyltransferase [Pseudothauera lacus]|uniref:Glycosyl transferase n=1 Tax=Pseudothauera lacus TaxID=2136175 RepID=A0A2T4IK16_9RHOO|nr:glycosyltransferase [Pseudothauera lacus]PTD98121.1 glycosyl transferase [Pseudothauera lacus]
MKVSVIIKALNEERNIARAIESALAAIAEVGSGEVILADSLSTDRTVELARQYPVRIVQLTDPADRCCGVGAEIGYRIAQGEYLYILDADMELDSGFLLAATRVMDDDPKVGGVGGLVKEMNVDNAEFRGRAAQQPPYMRAGEVDRLDGGGIYRKCVIDALGYLTNRNLHAFEEYELGVRVRAAGFRLLRLDKAAVRHYGHTDDSFKLLWRRWRSRYAFGTGELVREAVGKSYLWRVLREVRMYRQSVLTYGWWCAIGALSGLAAAGVIGWLLPLALFLLLPALAAVKRRSLLDGIYVTAFWNVYAAGLVAGFFSKGRGHPGGKFGYLVLQ